MTGMTDRTDQGFAYLPATAAGLGHVFARPKWIALACIAALTGLGWTALGAMSAGSFSGALDAICSASFASGRFSAVNAALVVAMWAAMVLAMMLPSAAPMILTYAEIADTAARKSEAVVSPLVLAGGYTVAWLAFAALAALAQLLLSRTLPLGGGLSAASALFSGAIFIAAGLYQFSALKRACLTQCQRPFPFFFTHWTTAPRGVFLLGLKQGLYCVGCCWAMMLVMLAVGAMNVIWMAGLGAIMTLEKMGNGTWFTRAVGVVLIAGGAAVVLAAAAAHWPAGAI